MGSRPNALQDGAMTGLSERGVRPEESVSKSGRNSLTEGIGYVE